MDAASSTAAPLAPPLSAPAAAAAASNASSLATAPLEPVPPPPPSLTDSRLYINREASWLAFNERVLDEGCDPTVPPLERLKFLAIHSSNLDEFFMIRVAGLKQQMSGHVEDTGPDALTPNEQLALISQQCHKQTERKYRSLLGEVLPALERVGLRVLKPGQITPAMDQFLADYFAREVFPVLTPIAVDPGHPFPHLRNKSLNLAVRFGNQSAGSRLRFGIVPVPAVLPRLVEVPDDPGRRSYVLLEDAIGRNVALLFPGMSVEGCYAFKVTRNWDLNLDEEEAEDLLVTIEREVRRRDRGSSVRLQITATANEELTDFLVNELNLGNDDVYRVPGPLNLPDLLPLLTRLEQKDLHNEPYTPTTPPGFSEATAADIFRLLGDRDVLLHHPYESFDPVVSFIEAAADDPSVLAIKQTLYRTGRDSPIVRALQRAAENGKQVTALVELKARMDEEANILGARTLEQAGVHVVYGLIGFKTHCKVTLVVRREPGGLRRYVHLGTGNYNPSTAKIYVDLSLFTAREDFGADATSIFNLLTGYSKPASWKKFSVAPLGMRQRVIELIDREAQLAAGTGKGRIIAKMNALVDPEVIRALYRASQAGAQVDLLVRGICCLRPGVPGVSDRIRVVSVVDRYLEHSRIWAFHASGKDEVFLSSADWMPRNFVRRVEIAFPIEDVAVKQRILDEILGTALADNVKARVLRADGTYERAQPAAHGAQAVRSQERFMALARRVAAAGDAPPVAQPDSGIFPATRERRERRRNRKRS